MDAKNLGHLVVQLHSFEIQRKVGSIFGGSSTLTNRKINMMDK